MSLREKCEENVEKLLFLYDCSGFFNVIHGFLGIFWDKGEGEYFYMEWNLGFRQSWT